MAGSKDESGRFELKEFSWTRKPTFTIAGLLSETDPIQVPHQYSDTRDIEISAFLTATIAWGQKTTIISNARKLISWMPGGPYEFITAAKEEDLMRFLPFVHRTFNGIDCIYFLKALKEHLPSIMADSREHF